MLGNAQAIASTVLQGMLAWQVLPPSISTQYALCLMRPSDHQCECVCVCVCVCVLVRRSAGFLVEMKTVEEGQSRSYGTTVALIGLIRALLAADATCTLPGFAAPFRVTSAPFMQ